MQYVQTTFRTIAHGGTCDEQVTSYLNKMYVAGWKLIYLDPILRVNDVLFERRCVFEMRPVEFTLGKGKKKV